MTETPIQDPDWEKAPDWAECWGLYMGEWCWFSGTDPWGVSHKIQRPKKENGPEA